MRTISAVTLISALCLAGAACDQAPSPTSPTNTAVGDARAVAQATAGTATDTAQAAGSTKKTAGPFFSITKLPAPWSEHFIVAAPDVQAMVFQISGTNMRSTALTQLSFMITANWNSDGTTLPAGYLTNFRLVYYPDGFGTTGTQIGVNPATTWTPGFTPADFLTIGVTPSFAFAKQNFTGVFALLGSVSGSGYRFNVRMQTGAISINGVEQPITNEQNWDLPVAGDTFHVQ